MAAGDVDVKVTTNRTFTGASFDGVDDYVQIPHHASQLGANLSNGFTISAWINPNNNAIAGNRILDKSTAGDGANGLDFHFNGIDNKIYLVMNTGVSSSAALTTTKVWNHVLVTVSSASLANFYINNSSSGVGNQNLVQSIATIITTGVMRIGSRSYVVSTIFNGIIKDVKMWDRVLTSEERALNYAGINVSSGQILNVPLKTDYNDVALGLVGTNSGTVFANIEDNVKVVFTTQRSTAGATGKYLMTKGKDGQIVTVAITE